MAARTVEDPQAIALALNGDQRGQGALISRYQHMVYTVAHRVMRNTMDAEEVTQDVFVKALGKLGEFQGGGKFSTWLYSIAYRTAISALRSRKQESSSLEQLQENGMEPAATMAQPVDERRAALDHALSQLPEEDAAILTMYYLEEMSVDEIVTVTSLGASNVKVKLHRGRKKMHDVLKDHLKEELWTLSAEE